MTRRLRFAWPSGERACFRCVACGAWNAMAAKGVRLGAVRGLVAGAAGTTALDVVTYCDMAIRGRPPSELPMRVTERLVGRMGLTALAYGDGAAANRRSGIGALLGYGNGLAAGAAYGAFAALRPRTPWILAAVALAAGTLLLSEGAATRLGATDWSTWSTADWIADIVPRLAFGVVTAVAMEALRR